MTIAIFYLIKYSQKHTFKSKFVLQKTTLAFLLSDNMVVWWQPATPGDGTREWLGVAHLMPMPPVPRARQTDQPIDAVIREKNIRITGHEPWSIGIKYNERQTNNSHTLIVGGKWTPWLIPFPALLHWNGNVILTKFLSLAAPKVVILKMIGASSDENFVKMTFPFQHLQTFFLH